jgi:hypothetical protein
MAKESEPNRPSQNSSGIPKKERRPRAGQPAFEPTKEQRAMVRMAVGNRIPQAEICTALLNPHSGKPIDDNTFRKAFAGEIATAFFEMRLTYSAHLAKQAQQGSLGAIIWWEKTRAGIRDPSYDRSLADKTDPAGSEVHHEIEVVGGLPQGSTPENPAGDVKPDGSVETDTPETIVGDDETNA